MLLRRAFLICVTLGVFTEVACRSVSRHGSETNNQDSDIETAQKSDDQEQQALVESYNEQEAENPSVPMTKQSTRSLSHGEYQKQIEFINRREMNRFMKKNKTNSQKFDNAKNKKDHTTITKRSTRSLSNGWETDTSEYEDYETEKDSDESVEHSYTPNSQFWEKIQAELEALKWKEMNGFDMNDYKANPQKSDDEGDDKDSFNSGVQEIESVTSVTTEIYLLSKADTLEPDAFDHKDAGFHGADTREVDGQEEKSDLPETNNEKNEMNSQESNHQQEKVNIDETNFQSCGDDELDFQEQIQTDNKNQELDDEIDTKGSQEPGNQEYEENMQVAKDKTKTSEKYHQVINDIDLNKARDDNSAINLNKSDHQEDKVEIPETANSQLTDEAETYDIYPKSVTNFQKRDHSDNEFNPRNTDRKENEPSIVVEEFNQQEVDASVPLTADSSVINGADTQEFNHREQEAGSQQPDNNDEAIFNETDDKKIVHGRPIRRKPLKHKVNYQHIDNHDRHLVHDEVSSQNFDSLKDEVVVSMNDNLIKKVYIPAYKMNSEIPHGEVDSHVSNDQDETSYKESADRKHKVGLLVTTDPDLFIKWLDSTSVMEYP